MQHIMETVGRLLLVVDDSKASERAVHYVAKMLAGRKRFEIHLFHVFPILPPRLLEWGGAEDPEALKKGDQTLQKEKVKWMHEAVDSAKPVFDKARAILHGAGVPDKAIQEHCSPSIHTEHVAQHCLDAASETGCRTVVVGREHYPWYRELFHHHTSPELVRKGRGLCIWIVE